MNKTVLSLAALPALALAVPAAAQSYDARGNASIQNRIVQMETQLQAGIRSGTIDRQEARTLRLRLREISRLERQYSRNGLTREEQRDLRTRLRAVRQELRLADNRGYGNQQYYGQGGPYEPYQDDWAEEDRGFLGNIVDSIFGGGGLRVGQRATGNLSGVPYQYRSQFRDGNGVYYRSDGERIYAIDARTNTVVRVHTPNR